MGNILNKQDVSSPIKEPKLSSESGVIPPEAKIPQITKESIESPLSKEQNEEIIEKENEQKEEDIPEENEDIPDNINHEENPQQEPENEPEVEENIKQEENQEQRQEEAHQEHEEAHQEHEEAHQENEEANQEHEEAHQEHEENAQEENIQEDPQIESPRDKEEEPEYENGQEPEQEQYIKINEREENNQEGRIGIKTPQKMVNFYQDGEWFQVDEKGQLYKVLQEGEGEIQQIVLEPLYQTVQESEGNINYNQDIQNLVLKANNEANYLMQSGKSKSSASNKFKSREPKDSAPREHLYKKVEKKIKIKEGNNAVINSDLIDIPRAEYPSVNSDNIVKILGQGMDTGEYKFVGEKTVIKENIPNKKIAVAQEEILQELNKRKKKKLHGSKKIKYEVIDKFYALTDINGKTIKRVQKTEYNKKTGGMKSNNYFYSNMNIPTNNNIQNNSRINNMSNMKINTAFGNSYSMSMKMQYMNNMGGMSSMSKMNNMNMNNMSIMNNMNGYNMTSLPMDNYSSYMLEQINKLRSDPQSFIGIIEDAKANISKDRYGRLIYNSRLKVALNSGEKAFDEAINFLKNANSMQPLVYNPMITVNVPSNVDEILDKDDLGNKVEYMLRSGINIKSYWRDVIKDPEISFLLMIIDDNGFNGGMRRKDILSPSIKYIGINSNEINNNFACYITLAN